MFGLKDGDLGGLDLEASASGAAEGASSSDWHFALVPGQSTEMWRLGKQWHTVERWWFTGYFIRVIKGLFLREGACLP